MGAARTWRTTIAQEPKEPAELPPPAWTPREEDPLEAEYEIEFKENLTHFYDALARVDDR